MCKFCGKIFECVVNFVVKILSVKVFSDSRLSKVDSWSCFNFIPCVESMWCMESSKPTNPLVLLIFQPDAFTTSAAYTTSKPSILQLLFRSLYYCSALWNFFFVLIICSLMSIICNKHSIIFFGEKQVLSFLLVSEQFTPFLSQEHTSWLLAITRNNCFWHLQIIKMLFLLLNAISQWMPLSGLCSSSLK